MSQIDMPTLIGEAIVVCFAIGEGHRGRIDDGRCRPIRDIYGLCGILVCRGKAVICHKEQQRYHGS
jgi:hypothetical protein